MRTPIGAAAACLAALTLAACGDDPATAPEGDAAPAPSSQTLAQTLDGADYDRFSAVIDNAGLDEVLGGVGPYTVFAPADAAFGADADFADEEMSAQAAALLRAHIVPGAITRADLEAAIDAAGADGAQMRTMADTLLTFRREGDAVTVSAEDGPTARLSGVEEVARNGVVQPIDALLIAPEPAGEG